MNKTKFEIQKKSLKNKSINSEQKSLSDYKVGDNLIIKDISAPLRLKRRLLDLGFVSGSKVTIINISPLKNSYLLEIHGYIIALRKNAVVSIKVRKE